MKIVVKIGTQSILSEQGVPIEGILIALAEQIVALKKQGHQIVLVSSGAVGYGRSLFRQILGREQGTSIEEKQLLASCGQHELMHVYSRIFKNHNMVVSQLLLTKQDFQTRKHYLNISRLLTEMLSHSNILPILNENDSVAIEELIFTDNDELAGLIAGQINADKLIILSNVEGVFTGHPNDPGTALIPYIDPRSGWPDISSAKSTQGRGGMISKLSTARKMSNLGITTHIASMNQPSILTRTVMNEPVGTTIIPLKSKTNLKKWMACSPQERCGSIVINVCLNEILKENKRVISILPLGIEAFSGEFKKGDIISILSPNKIEIGIGIARYDSQKLKNVLGKKNKSEFIHYNHMHLF